MERMETEMGPSLLGMGSDSNANDKSRPIAVSAGPGTAPGVGGDSIHGPVIPPASGVETIYELCRSPLDSPTSHVVSERVQTLASQIYNELQKIMSRCSDDEEAVSGLMPLVVNVLESLDLALIENQQLQVELELCKDDNEQLVVAFEKEKTNKKRNEQKLLEFEFQSDEEKQQLQTKIDSLENIVKMLELKSKNSADHATRLEDKETELKSEYNKLHNRYTELLRSHCDLMERVKILIGNDEGFSMSGTGPASLASGANFRSILNRKSEMEETLEEEQGNVVITSPSMPRQVWGDGDLSLEDASIIEDIEDIPKDKDTPSLTVNDNFFGMEKEVENLITENNELMATKNALNIVKDDLIAKVDELQSELTMSKDEVQQLSAVKNRLKSRICNLEEDLKKTKEELEESKQKVSQHKEDDEEGIPMAQRKRFTRVEMARVLMERNQYKERLIELQEAIRWTELIRASKNEGEKKSAIWKFFSNLFSASGSTAPTKESPTKSSSTGNAAVRFSATNPSTVTPALEAMRRRAKAQQSSDLVLLMDSDLSSERARALRNVRAHVNRSNGDRIQAYGWSIAGSGASGNASESPSNPITGKNASVPVPIYCRPLSGDDVGMKIWCAAAVDLSGGEAGFPGNTGSNKAELDSKESIGSEVKDEASKESEAAIADLESELSRALNEQSYVPSEKKLSTFVWICGVSHSRSKVTIVNIRSNPSEVLDSFIVKTHLLCIASVPGAKVKDLQGCDGVEMEGNPGIKVCRVEVKKGATQDDLKDSGSEKVKESAEASGQSTEPPETAPSPADTLKGTTLEKLTEYVAYSEPASPSAQEETPSSPVYQPMSTCLPTMWLGGQNGLLYIHSSIAQWSHCIASVKLPDSILQMIHFRGRVFVALANGQCCIFMRSTSTGEWNFDQYLVIDIAFLSNNECDLGALKSSSGGGGNASVTGSPTTTATYSIRCIEVTKSSIWLGYRNQVFVLDPVHLRVDHSFAVHPRKETQVRQLAALGDGVWCSLRLDSTLKLYSALKPFSHLQDVDIEPYVSKMLSPKAFSFIRITALKASNARLWIGTANGVILSLPCDGSSSPTAREEQTVVSSSESGRIAVSTFIPLCNSTAAQLSFHGHKDAVKFFVSTKNLILSGGEGYIDFRLNSDDDGTSLSKGDRSHLIVWEINS